MYRIGKTFEFSAAHALHHLPDGHPCKRLHGHNYKVTLILEREETNEETGFVLDFGELDAVKQYIDERLDHRYLNDVLGGVNCDDWQRGLYTTSESIARAFFQRFCLLYTDLVGVRVSETDKTFAEFWGRV